MGGPASEEVGPLRRSIEVEYWVVDDAGRLTEPESLVEVAPGVEREFVEPLLEIKTTPCETTAELRDELLDRLGRVLRRADDLGLHLVPLGTPLGDEEIRELPSERTRIQNQVVGEEFGYVRHCAGTHVHVEKRPGREVEQMNLLVALDPALALVNSSPFYRGERLAAGARSELYRRLAYQDLPHQGRLWSYASDVEEWTRYLERRWEEFVTAAMDAGVDRQAIEANFDPESAVWTPVQLRESFPTVEWRSPDTALPSQVLRLAEGVFELAEHLDTAALRIEGDTGGVREDTLVVPEFGALLGYVDAAIEDGLTSPDVTSYLRRMGFDVDAFAPVTHEFDGRESVSAEEARDLRLEHAERLQRDIRSVRVSGD
ncbi:glutamate-cysteine ligase family protein [Halomarina salina]|uniref:Glutamate-cysteine ligase family protein n=1 Tax=Halomarina salina TaxID=1872699 RepID=A0ABD5RLN1_9EURY|nr:glutamate-cysteine ligase family protein [Halomarina salina]